DYCCCSYTGSYNFG
nr:immunoglobulin light chain junction region [Macaca mulatta]